MSLDMPESIELWRQEHDDQIRERLSRHIEQKTTDFGPRSLVVPASTYTDPVRWEAERREVFGKMPMFACLSQDIPNAGDIHLYEEAGASIFVARMKDGSVRAFLNMCMHRAARLVSDCTPRKRFTCPFHAWTYDLEGKLIGVPRRDAFDAEDLAGRNLVRVPAGEWGGLVMVKATPGEEEIDVQGYLGGFAPTVASLKLDQSYPVARGRLGFEANWKYALDTYGEGYHIGFLHPHSVGALFHGDLIAVERQGKHSEMAFAALPHHAIESGDGETLTYSPVYFIYPNLVINVQPMSNGRAFAILQRVYPGATVHQGYACFSTYKQGGPVEDEDRADYVAGHDLIMGVVGNEDFSISQTGYVNIRNAPSGYTMAFGRNEIPAMAAQLNIAADIGMPL